MTMLFRRIAFAFVAAVLLAALWIMFKPNVLPAAASKVTIMPAIAATMAPAAAVTSSSVPSRAFALIVKDGKLVSETSVLKAREGEQVTLSLTNNRSDELHLHGYDLHLRTVPGETATLEFHATRTGRFGLELHRAHAELGALE